MNCIIDMSSMLAVLKEAMMRVNIYAEELTDRVEIIKKEVEGKEFTAVRFYLYLPVTMQHVQNGQPIGKPHHVSGPFIHGPGDDDSAAVTFWGKRDMRPLLQKALRLLDEHYGEPVERDPGDIE